MFRFCRGIDGETLLGCRCFQRDHLERDLSGHWKLFVSAAVAHEPAFGQHGPILFQ